MLSAVEFIQGGLTQLHKNLNKALADLTPEQLHAVPAGHPKANTIAWGLWHYARTEDNIVRWVIQDRRPPIWAEAGYAERLGLPPVAQGTGMSAEEALALRITDVPLFQEYMRQVWAGTEQLFTDATPALFDKTVTVKPLGDMTVIECLGQVGLTAGSAAVALLVVATIHEPLLYLAY